MGEFRGADQDQHPTADRDLNLLLALECSGPERQGEMCRGGHLLEEIKMDMIVGELVWCVRLVPIATSKVCRERIPIRVSRR